MKYNEITDAIKTLLDENSEDLGIQEVFSTLPDGMTKYPCVVILPTGHTGEYRDMRDNVRNYLFLIRIYGNLEDSNESEVQVMVRDITDGIINLLEGNTNLSLSGTCDYATVPSNAFRFESTPARLYLGEITYRVRVRYNRTT